MQHQDIPKECKGQSETESERLECKSWHVQVRRICSSHWQGCWVLDRHWSSRRMTLPFVGSSCRPRPWETFDSWEQFFWPRVDNGFCQRSQGWKLHKWQQWLDMHFVALLAWFAHYCFPMLRRTWRRCRWEEVGKFCNNIPEKQMRDHVIAWVF